MRKNVQSEQQQKPAGRVLARILAEDLMKQAVVGGLPSFTPGPLPGTWDYDR